MTKGFVGLVGRGLMVGRCDGRVIGLGRTAGRVDGLANGRFGLTDGLVDGLGRMLGQGRADGRVLGRGRMVPGLGRIEGRGRADGRGRTAGRAFCAEARLITAKLLSTELELKETDLLGSRGTDLAEANAGARVALRIHTVARNNRRKTTIGSTFTSHYLVAVTKMGLRFQNLHRLTLHFEVLKIQSFAHRVSA